MRCNAHLVAALRLVAALSATWTSAQSFPLRRGQQFWCSHGCSCEHQRRAIFVLDAAEPVSPKNANDSFRTLNVCTMGQAAESNTPS